MNRLISRSTSIFRSWGSRLTILAVVLLSLFPLFGHLDSQPLRLWDESRLAHNAAEMYNSESYLVVQFQGKPEHWSTKPPLMIWLQCLSYKVVGVNEMGVRLPSAFAGLMLIMCMIWFLIKMRLSPAWAIVAMILLLSIRGFNGEHGIRYGEYDGLLALFVLIQLTGFTFWLIHPSEPDAKFRWLFYLGMVGAVWTKGIAGLLLAPVYLFWMIRMLGWRELVKLIPEWCVISILLFGYYPIRELLDPGYLKAVWNNEISQRFTGNLENHREEWTYYFHEFHHQTSGSWIIMLLIITLGIYYSNSPLRRVLIFLSSAALILFVILNLASTKIYWYLLPIYPILVLTTVLVVSRGLQTVTSTKRKVVKWGVYVLIGAVSSVLYGRLIISTSHITAHVPGDHGFYEVTNFIRSQLGSKDTLHWTFIDTDYSGHNWWYIDRLNEQGHDMVYDIHLDSVEKGDILLLRQKEIRDSVKVMYHTQNVFNHTDYSLIKLYDLR